MQTGPCPRCQQLVRFPDGDPATSVRCPMCKAEFPLREFLEHLPPEVEVVAPDQADELSLEPAEAAPRRAFDFRDTLPIPETVAPRIEKSASSARKSSSRRPRSLGGELIKILFGGLVGVALAQLLLWWLPNPWRRDPLGLAPRLPAAFSLLAPADLRRAASEPPAGRHQDPDHGNMSDSPTPSLTPPDDSATIGPRAAQAEARVNGLQLEQSLQRAVEAAEALERAESPSNERKRQWGEAIGQLAHAITFADAQDPRVTQQADPLRELVVRIDRSEQLQAELAQQQSGLWNQPPDAMVGVLVFGTVQAVQPRGAHFETRLQTGDRELSVLSHRDPTHEPGAAFQVGDRVGILGMLTPESLVPAAADSATGRSGNQEFFLWGGFPVRLPSDYNASGV